MVCDVAATLSSILVGNTTPDVTRNVSCVAAAVARMSECVALWTDCNGIPSALGGICHRRTPKTTNIQVGFPCEGCTYNLCVSSNILDFLSNQLKV